MSGPLTACPATVHSEPLQAYMQGRLDIADKDLAIALSEAKRVGFGMPAAALVSQLMARIYRVDDPNKR